MSAVLVWREINDGVTHATARWPTKDIIYVAVVGGVMLAALLEWILWLLAFVYCLIKVFQKADGEERWSIRILAILNIILFVAMRCVFLPIMVVTLPLPSEIVRYFPEDMVIILQWFAFWSFAGLLTIPWLFCVYQLVTHNVGRTRRIKTVLNEDTAPKITIVMPCYNEEPEVLLRTVDSIVDCEYPPSSMHIFLSFDGDAQNELYLNTIEALGVPLVLDQYPSSIDIRYRGCRVTVSRFPHGGKRKCQKHTFRLIDRVYAEYLRRNDNIFVLFIDSDCVLDRYCIQNFMYEMELKPGSRHNMLAQTGVITSTTTKNTLITILQDMEYIHGQLFERSVESGCGAVTCLPGALTMLRFSAFRRMAKFYFAEKAEQCNDFFDYGKCHLGEDRWLTHLFMIGCTERYQIQMNTGAFCKTEAVQTFGSLLKQRRRWFLGFLTNEVCMLTDIRLWKRYPLLLTLRLCQDTIRTTALLFFILTISIITTSQRIVNLPVGFIAVSLGLNWVLMIYFGFRLGRLKVMLYPIMFVVNPSFNWMYTVYGIFTASERTWGGPRADAGKADEHTTPAQAIEQALRTGNEMNVVPETFAAHRRQPHRAPLMPSGHLEGRFAPAEAMPGGWYRQPNDSDVLRPDMTLRDVENKPWMSRSRRESGASDASSTRTSSGIQLPRRIESIFDPEDARVYLNRLADQRPAGGAYYETPCGRAVSTFGSVPLTRQGSLRSAASADSDDSVSLHFGIPDRRPTQPAKQIDADEAHPRGSHLVSGAHAGTAPPTTHDATLLPIPSSNEQPSGRDHSRPPGSTDRTGQRPLARKSFTRIASPAHEEDMGVELSNGAEVIELERLMAARTSQEIERRGRRSTEQATRRPRKLSKQRRSRSSDAA